METVEVLESGSTAAAVLRTLFKNPSDGAAPSEFPFASPAERPCLAVQQIAHLGHP